MHKSLLDSMEGLNSLTLDRSDWPQKNNQTKDDVKMTIIMMMLMLMEVLLAAALEAKRG